MQNRGLAIEWTAPLHIHNHIPLWSAFTLFDISDLYEAWHMLELFWLSRLTAAQSLELLSKRTVKNVSFNPFLPSPSSISRVGEANAHTLEYWCSVLAWRRAKHWKFLLIYIFTAFCLSLKNLAGDWSSRAVLMDVYVVLWQLVLLICFYRAVYSKWMACWIFYRDFRLSKEYFPVY